MNENGSICIADILSLAPLVRRVCKNMVRTYPDPTSLSEDLSQEILMKAIQKIHQYDGSSKLSTWLTTIARNHVIDFIRSRRNIHEQSLDEMLENDSVELKRINKYSAHNYVENSLIFNIDTSRRLGSLRYDDALMLRLSMWGYDYYQIAHRLQIDLGTVKSRLHRLRYENS